MKRLFFLLLVIAGLLNAEDRFATIYVQDRPFRVEIADTPEKQAKGLMFRRCLKEGYGMLFVFPEEEIRSFWMKNTLISLDMIFLNGEKQVVDVYRDVPPCQADPCPSYTSALPARFVLEIAGGLAAKLKLKIGDKIFVAID
jgi:uncharacterized membrane protein (UPF0127 family)